MFGLYVSIVAFRFLGHCKCCLSLLSLLAFLTVIVFVLSFTNNW